MNAQTAAATQPDAEFQRLYQQAYYRHSGFGPDAVEAPAARRSFQPRKRVVPGFVAEFGFAALALVFFIVPAVTAAAFLA